MNRYLFVCCFFIVLIASSCLRPSPETPENRFHEFLASSDFASGWYEEVQKGEIPDFSVVPNNNLGPAEKVIREACMARIQSEKNKIEQHSLQCLSELIPAIEAPEENIPDSLLAMMAVNYPDGIASYCEFLGQAFFDSLPAFSIRMFRKAKNLHIKQKDYFRAAYSYLNLSLLYEKLGDYESATYMCDQAIGVWEEQGDTLQLANLLKLKGLFLAHRNRFEEGKKLVNESFNMYHRLGNENGKYVALHDLGELYLLEGKSDSSLFCFYSEKSYWKKCGDVQRCFIANIGLIKSHDYNNDKDSILSLIQENNGMETNPSIHEFNRITYRKISDEMIKKYKINTGFKQYN